MNKKKYFFTLLIDIYLIKVKKYMYRRKDECKLHLEAA